MVNRVIRETSLEKYLERSITKEHKVWRDYNGLLDRIEELEAGIEAIAPWLSASLTEHVHDGKGDYLKACNEIFKLDQKKNAS